VSDTIFAVSSGAPPAAIAVLRLSGAGAFDAAERLAGSLPESRTVALRSLRDPASGELLDRALVVVFPGPASATGEDIAELHLHGGRAVVRAVEAVISVLPGMRPAAPGEFTRRALANGRIDLSEAEGLGDLLSAETEGQRRAALLSAEGVLRREVEGWGGRALSLAAQVEALLDHSDEDDVAEGVDSLNAIHAAAAALAADIRTVTDRPPVERLRDGLRVVLAGPPNAGKSTLLNAMTERDAAIVSPIAGTTRDRIEAPVVRNGFAWLLIDTAGLTATPSDAIEAIGVARARASLGAADILLWLGDQAPPPHPQALWLHARADMPERVPNAQADLAVSAATGEGVAVLWGRLERLAAGLLPPSDLLALNSRQRDLCSAASAAISAATREQDLLLVAEHMRTALRAFDAITGRAGVEAMLDALFDRFCVGK
jgi:tRNA modification GTPase